MYAFKLQEKFDKGVKVAEPDIASKRRATTVGDFLTKYSGFMKKKNSQKVFKAKLPEISPGDGGWEWHQFDRDMVMKPYMSFADFIQLISIFFTTTSRNTKNECIARLPARRVLLLDIALVIFRVFDFNEDGNVDYYDIVDCLKMIFEYSTEIAVPDIEKLAQRIIEEGDAKHRSHLDMAG